MRNMWLKISALALATTLLMAALLAGCRGGDTPDGIPPTASNTTSNTTTMLTPLSATDGYYELSYNYDEGKFSLSDVNIKSGSVPYRWEPPVARYKYEVLSSGGEVLHSFKFEVPLEVHYDYPGPGAGELRGGVFELNKVFDILYGPYFINGATINLYDPNGTSVLSVDIRQFAVELTETGKKLSKMLDKAANIVSVKYDELITVSGRPTTTTTVWWKKNKIRRQAGDYYWLIDQDAKTAYTYMPTTNRAIKQPFDRREVPVDDAKYILNYSPKVVGTESIDGKVCSVVEYTTSRESVKVWIWQNYGLPIRKEMTSSTGKTTIEYKNIDFTDIPDSTLALPSGVIVR